jgi:hypothetical protein
MATRSSQDIDLDLALGEGLAQSAAGQHRLCAGSLHAALTVRMGRDARGIALKNSGFVIHSAGPLPV